MGIALDIEPSDDKDIQRQLRYQYGAANKLRASFFRCLNAVKNVLFLFFLYAHVCIKIMVLFQEVTMQTAEIVCGLQFSMQSSIQPALQSEC